MLDAVDDVVDDEVVEAEVELVVAVVCGDDWVEVLALEVAFDDALEGSVVRGDVVVVDGCDGAPLTDSPAQAEVKRVREPRSKVSRGLKLSMVIVAVQLRRITVSPLGTARDVRSTASAKPQ